MVRGLKEILDNEFDDKGMKFSDIINILHDTMKREIRLNNKNIELIFSFEKDFYTRKHYHLMSTLRNLIMNAVDAINNKEKKNKIELHHHTHEELHRFIISDTGEGIHKNDMEFIFSPGYSTKINYSTGEINRGLGLSIVKNIVEEELGGKINVSSSLGKGTNFYIEIPKEELEDKENEDIYS